MKLKDLKATRTALVEAIEIAEGFKPEVTVNLRDSCRCMFHKLYNESWSSSKVYEKFKLGDWSTSEETLSPKLTREVYGLFLDDSADWKNVDCVSIQEWLLRARYVLNLLNTAISKKELAKFQATN